ANEDESPYSSPEISDSSGGSTPASFPPPALDLLFSRNGITNVSERLKIDEPGDVIPLRKSLNDFAFVLYHSALQVAGHPGIEHAAGVAQNVDVIHAHFSFSALFLVAIPSAAFVSGFLLVVIPSEARDRGLIYAQP